MKLSIIVPVFNMAADGKLEYCIQSLLNQTIDDYEVIAVDDASTDNSLEVLKNQAADFTKGAIVLPPLQERSIIKNLQEKGVSVFDNVELERYDHNQKEILKKDLLELFSLVKID